MKAKPLVFIVASLCASVAIAAPEITVVKSDRKVKTSLVAQNGADYFPSQYSAFRTISGPTNGPWTDSLDQALDGETGAFAAGFAYQQSNQSTFAIEGEGSVSTQAVSLGPDEQGSATAESIVSYTITVPEDTAFGLTGVASFEASGSDTTASMSVIVIGTRPGGGFLFTSRGVNSADMDPANPFQFIISDSVQGGSELQISVAGGCRSEGSSDGLLSFEFILNLGDTDRDGLLDVWETDGIDLDGDGVPEVVLAGADPMKKDLFVEVDAMSGAPVNHDALNDVVAAFAAAPGHLVKNPDGSDGINLHIVVSDTNLPTGDLPDFNALYALKDDWWGSQADRDDPNAEAIREARSKAFRYCIWGTTHEGPGGPSGRAERPGNDFIVASDSAAIFGPRSRDALAAIFMHELGHNLGLKHGGQDDQAFKPNYLSVMGYNYMFPFQDSVLAHHLDYCRHEIMPLNESALEEQLGLDGPSNRVVMFNSAPDGSPPVRTLVYADDVQVDWNGNGMFDFDPVEQDISRIAPFVPASTSDLHVSYTDWDKLWYHLSGAETFEDGIAPPGSIPDELTRDELLAISATAVLDLTAPDCVADLTTTGATIPGFAGYGVPDGVADLDDLGYYLNFWLALDLRADLTTSGATIPGFAGFGEPDGVVDLDDLGYFLNAWLAGCG